MAESAKLNKPRGSTPKTAGGKVVGWRRGNEGQGGLTVPAALSCSREEGIVSVFGDEKSQLGYRERVERSERWTDEDGSLGGVAGFSRA